MGLQTGSKSWPRSLGVMLAASMSSLACAVVPNTGADTDYLWVGPTGGGSGTAIARRSVITARHVGGSTYESQGKIYTASSRIDHPAYDITILNFSEDLPGWHELGTSAPVGTPIEMVGFGRTGVLNSTGTGYDIQWSSGGTRIAAPNNVEFEWLMPGIGPSMIAYLGGNGEGAAVAGDSGGGFFAGGKLVGVISFAMNATGGTLPDYGFASLNNGVPYHMTGAINLTKPDVRAWVLDNIVPAPGAACVFTAMCLAGARRRGRSDVVPAAESRLRA